MTGSGNEWKVMTEGANCTSGWRLEGAMAFLTFDLGLGALVSGLVWLVWLKQGEMLRYASQGTLQEGMGL